jgi:hypothetical protein
MSQTLSKRQRRNDELSMKPKFTPLHPYVVHIVNQVTNTNLLHDLIQAVTRTDHFSIDTESDMYTNRPALIQIECIGEHRSTVILVEMRHLPADKQGLVFWLIRALLKFVLEPRKTIYSWSDARRELNEFVPCGLFSSDTIQQLNVVDVQQGFKQWHDSLETVDSIHRPQWGLQSAIAFTYDQFLDKSETLNRWSRGLQQHRRTASDHDHQKIQSMINYAVNDCLAVTKLVDTITKELI